VNESQAVQLIYNQKLKNYLQKKKKKMKNLTLAPSCNKLDISKVINFKAKNRIYQYQNQNKHKRKIT
jgi:hypothetical protein